MSSTPQHTSVVTATSPNRGWTAHLPLAFVAIVLVTLVTLPVLGERYAGPLNRELVEVVEPARGLVTQIHVAVAIEGAAFHDFVETSNEAFLRRYRQEYARELEVYENLEPLVHRLGDTVRMHYDNVRALERDWHGMIDTILNRQQRQPDAQVRATTTEEDAFERLLIAAAALDDALGRSAQKRRQAINVAERLRRRITVVLGLVALAGVGGVGWLAQRIRVYARQAEERRVELERATESRARLMRGVSHDLKNPLGAIDGHAALLEGGMKGPLNREQAESVGRIRRSVQALLGLITDLLELSKAETGHLSVRPRPTNLADVCREAADEHRDAAAAAGHQLQTEIPDGLPPVHTDPDRVRQVLGNLLSNAVKYTPSGGQIVVRGEERQPNGLLSGSRFVAIDVVDSGPGIPADKMEEIFKEFSRLDTGTTPGTGLGLPIARRISRLLGGDVSAASEEGRGATFTLWLPIDAGVERLRDKRP
jgi:signal transduction histidine kinase